MQSRWVRYIVEVLLAHPTGLARQDVIDRVARKRSEAGYSLPRDIVRTVQSAFNGHHSGSSEFRRRGRKAEDDFLYPVGGKRSGIWGIHPEKAEQWLGRNSN